MSWAHNLIELAYGARYMQMSKKMYERKGMTNLSLHDRELRKKGRHGNSCLYSYSGKIKESEVRS